MRHACGYDSLGEGDFELRTPYSHRHRLSQHNLEHGTNLLEAAFVDIADQQIASNIAMKSRPQLTVEAIQQLPPAA